ncbi:uncharacterized protein LOC143424059 [Xylocopa sonorina]|uniref:uncharacterized protein LOC143424059 n=1 Tax=Xylocopa sonorina TaxID=1818115 RepID=UPI00403A90BB
MKSSFKHVITLLLLSLLHFSEPKNDVHEKSKSSRAHSKTFGKHPNGGLFSFNSDEGKLSIDWAITIPFVSIPLEHKIEENGALPSLLNVNVKSLGIVGLIAALFTVIPPLFSKTHSHFNYRSMDDEQWLQMGNTINEMILGNAYVVPCVQRVVCSIVSVATHTDNPTSVNKIIDGLSSHKWIKDVTNGTIIQDAVAVGRKGNEDCEHVYKDCLLTPKLLRTMMNELGIV